MVIYKEWNGLIQSLPREKRLRFYDILFTYEDDNSLPEIKDSHLKSVLEYVLMKVKENDLKFKAKCEKAKKSAELRWSKNANNANACDGIASHINAMHNENENENENKKKSVKENFTPPTLEEVVQYFIDNGYDESVAVRAFNGYAVAGWKDSNGKQIRNWKQKMHQVWFKPEHKRKAEQESLLSRFKNSTPVTWEEMAGQKKGA